MKEKLRFAALRRVSTEQQEKVGESLRTQTTAIQEITVNLGSIVEWYGGQEHATPGHEKKEVERLLRDAQKQPCKFDAVIVAHPDRWSRDNSASRAGLEVFREHGVRFFGGATEYDLFNPDHEMYLGISAVIGQFQARNQMLKSLVSRINRAERGVPTGGKLPFGRKFIRTEDRQGGRWEIDPAKKRLIEDAAKRYLAGEAIDDLANEYGMNASNLHKVLTVRSGPNWQVEFKSKVLNIHKVVEIAVPRLLPHETILAIGKRARANRTYGHGPAKHFYLFARMIQCAHCGYAMFGQTNHNGHRYYRHAHTERDRTCSGSETKSWVPAAVVEDAVMRHLFETFGNPVAVQRAMEEATPDREKIQEELRHREQILAELAKVESSRQRILALVVKDTISNNDATVQLKKLKERQDKLETERTRLDDELAHVPGREVLVRVAKEVSARFRPYTNARAIAKTRRANEAFDEMTQTERRALCQSVFNGILPDGQRMGVFISWDESGKKWGYRIEGHLIDANGPVNKAGFFFGAAPGQKALVNSSALH